MNVINWSEFKSLDELNESLTNYVESEYNNKIHSSIKQKPIDKYLQYINNIRFISSNQELNYIFLYRCSRKVKNDSTISIQNMLFETPLKYIGERINVRYDPTSPDKAYIFSDDDKLIETIKPVNKIENSKIKRKSNIKPVDFSCFSSTNK